MNLALQGIYSLAMEEKDMEKAEQIAEKQKKLAQLLEMGNYMEAYPGLDLAVFKKDKESAIQILTEIVHGLKTIGDHENSGLYSHMKFFDAGTENIAFMLKRGLEEDKSMGFLRKDERYEDLIKKLESY